MFRSSAALSLLVAVLLSAGCASGRHINVVRSSGDRAFARAEYRAAETQYQEVVQRDPADWQYRVNLARTQIILNEPLAARENLAIAHRLRPDNDDIVDLYSHAMLEAGDHDDLYIFLKGRAERMGRVQDYLRLGFFLDRANDVDNAERALLTAARIDRASHVDPQLALHDFYARLGDHEKAMNRLRYALWIDLRHPGVLRAIRDRGQIPGPSFAAKPPEAP